MSLEIDPLAVSRDSQKNAVLPKNYNEFLAGKVSTQLSNKRRKFQRNTTCLRFL